MKKIKISVKIVLLIIFIYLVKYIFVKYNIGIPCLFHKLTNFYCPGCGMTRAIMALMNFDLIMAIRNNVLILVLIYFSGIYLYNYYNDAKVKVPRKLIIIFLIIAVIFGIIRNIEYFDWLKPV